LEAFTTHEDWYKVSAEFIAQNGGKGLISKYNHSVYKLIRATFPEHLWNPRLFGAKINPTRPKRFWQQPQNRQAVIEELKQKLSILKICKWYCIGDSIRDSMQYTTI
jgi:hypothetical protein